MLKLFGIPCVGILAIFAAGPEEDWTTLTSSRLGLSIEHPACWEKSSHLPGWAPTTYLTEEDAQKAPVTVTAFKYPACSHEGFNGAGSVTCRRAYDGTVEDFVEEQHAQVARHDARSPPIITSSFEALDFRFADGSAGKKTIRRLLISDPKYAASGMTYLTYCRLSERRLFVLTLPALTTTFVEQELEQAFDRVARSLRLATPHSDPPVAGTYKHLKKYGVGFDYPGEWSWDGGAFDDDESIEFRQRLIHITAPDATVTLTVRFVASSLETYAKTTPQELQQFSGGSSAVKITPIMNHRGQSGLALHVEYPMYWTSIMNGAEMYWLNYRVNDFQRIKETRTFTLARHVLPVTDDHVAVLELTCRGPFKQFEAMIEHIGKSFTFALQGEHQGTPSE